MIGEYPEPNISIEDHLPHVSAPSRRPLVVSSHTSCLCNPPRPEVAQGPTLPSVCRTNTCKASSHKAPHAPIVTACTSEYVARSEVELMNAKGECHD